MKSGHTAFPRAFLGAAALACRTIRGERSGGGLRELGRHGGGVGGLAVAGGMGGGAALASAGADGTVRLWDPRAASAQAGLLEAPGKAPLFCVDCLPRGHLLAAGAHGAVHLFDRRGGPQAGLLGTIEDSFGDDVTQLKFVEGTGEPQRLLAAGEDGALSLFDTAEALGGGEDEGLLGSFQGAPVRNLGTYGDGGARIWWTTGNETLHLADWRGLLDHAAMELPEGHEHAEPIDFTNPRGQAGKAGKKAGEPALSLIDYLVGCVYNPQLGRLLLAAGASGSLGLFPVSEEKKKLRQPAVVCAKRAPTDSPSRPQAHKAVVRGVEFLAVGASGAGALLTAGEDGAVAMWEPCSEGADAPGGGGGRERPEKSRTARRGADPY